MARTVTWETCFTRKTKRPRLNLSLGTSVDQPSPKCCSKTTLILTPDQVNGSPVPYMARKWGVARNGRKTPKKLGESGAITVKFTNGFPAHKMATAVSSLEIANVNAEHATPGFPATVRCGHHRSRLALRFRA